MKKFRNTVVLIMTVCLVFGLAACGKNENSEKMDADAQQISQENESSEEERQTEKKDTLVVYFSATGTTKGVAEKIADITDADMYEIVPADPYSSEDLDYGNDNSRTSDEMNDPAARPEIGSDKISLEGYSALYIGYPIWWGEAPRIMSTFVESYDFNGITVIPFCTSGSSGIERSCEQLEKQAGSGTWLPGRRFSGGTSDSELKDWIDGLNE